MKISKGVIITSLKMDQTPQKHAKHMNTMSQEALKGLLEHFAANQIKEVLVILNSEAESILKNIETMICQIAKQISVYFTFVPKDHTLVKALSVAHHFCETDSFALYVGNGDQSLVSQASFETLLEAYFEQKHSVVGITHNAKKPFTYSVSDHELQRVVAKKNLILEEPASTYKLGLGDVFQWNHNWERQHNPPTGFYILRSEIFLYLNETIGSEQASEYNTIEQLIDTLSQDQLVYGKIIG